MDSYNFPNSFRPINVNINTLNAHNKRTHFISFIVNCMLLNALLSSLPSRFEFIKNMQRKLFVYRNVGDISNTLKLIKIIISIALS